MQNPKACTDFILLEFLIKNERLKVINKFRELLKKQYIFDADINTCGHNTSHTGAGEVNHLN